METTFHPVRPIPPLKTYVDRLWVFESDKPLPDDDMKLVVPDGKLLLLVPFANRITGLMGGKHYVAPTHRIALVGMSDRPTVVDSAKPGHVGIIGAEINAIGAYRFFHLRLKDIKNDLHPLTDLLGNTVRRIEQRIADVECIHEKVRVLQQFLLSLFVQRDADTIFEYCIQQIVATKGRVSIPQLEQRTGYTGRWLHMKFEERLGIGAKNLSSIVRFQHHYQALLSNSEGFFERREFYHHYHDESHFIKDFKRFTGMSPMKLLLAKNEFGNTFNQD
jgi:AraC-like DNA-binding protein